MQEPQPQSEIRDEEDQGGHLRRPSHSSPNSTALSDSAFADNCSISPLEGPPPLSHRVTFAPTVISNPKGTLRPQLQPQSRRKNKWLPDFTPRQWVIFIIFVGTNFLAGMVYNMKGPFYPQEAETKGVSPSSFGFVFGIFEFTKVFASPFYGKYMNQLGTRRVFLASLYVIGICSILFGLLDEIQDATAFLVCSLALRVIEAIGSSGYSCATNSIIAHEFMGSGSIAKIFAILESFFGVGLIIAPPLGGVLFQVAGYPLPFITIGLLIFTSANLVCVVMPRNFTARDSDGRAIEGFNIFTILGIKGVLFSALGVFACACSAGFINATLEPHLRQFNMSPFWTGVVFAIFGLVYALTSPGWGWICDRVREPKWITFVGAISNFIGFLLIGPAPFFQFGTILWVTCVGLVLHGLALGAIFVSLFTLAFAYAVDSGMSNDMKTHAVVSGLFVSVLSLGMFLGPVVGGILFDHVGFRWGSLFVLFSMASLIILVLSYIIFQKSPLRPPSSVINPQIHSNETDPLLASPHLPLVEEEDERSQSQSRSQSASGSYGSV